MMRKGKGGMYLYNTRVAGLSSGTYYDKAVVPVKIQDFPTIDSDKPL